MHIGRWRHAKRQDQPLLKYERPVIVSQAEHNSQTLEALLTEGLHFTGKIGGKVSYFRRGDCIFVTSRVIRHKRFV